MFVVNFKDSDGFHYKHPERDCTKCLNYPCLENMDKLRSNFAAYGCKNWSDSNVFNTKNKIDKNTNNCANSSC